jgi:hypothetical protein
MADSHGVAENNSVTCDVMHWICFSVVPKRTGHKNHTVLSMAAVHPCNFRKKDTDPRLPFAVQNCKSLQCLNVHPRISVF